MITFRCWYCGRRFAVADDRIGERLSCTCKHMLKVPKRSGGRSKVHRPVDWLIESVVYGGGGAILGASLALLLLFQTPLFVAGGRWRVGGVLIGGLAAAGFLLGVLGGERGINWVGRMIRSREED
jgi:hypothetical protein